MLRTRLRIGVVLFLSIALNPASVPQALSNDTSVSGHGSSVFPIANPHIKMVSEKIDLTVSEARSRSRSSEDRTWYVDVTMNFRNFGPATFVQIGFPFEVDVFEDGTFRFDPEFKAFVDGKEVEVTRKQGGKNPKLKGFYYPRVYTFYVGFVKGETRTIRHTYKAGGVNTSIGVEHFKYILRTGALWREDIERIDISLKIKAADASSFKCITPKEHRAERKGDDIFLGWTFEDIEPDFDVVIGTIYYLEATMTLEELVDESEGRGLALYECPKRYFINMVYAHYGYSFKNPFVRAWFYEDGKYNEKKDFSIDRISPRHQKYLEYLSK